VLGLLLAANGRPVLAKRLLGDRWALPLDGGVLFLDQRPLLGSGKTWRGLAVALAGCALVAWLFGYGWRLGFLFGAAAMLGDLLSSFAKRRLGLRSGSMALGVDQIPESLVPLLVCRTLLGLDWPAVLLLVVLFVASELMLSRLLFRLGIRETPY